MATKNRRHRSRLSHRWKVARPKQEDAIYLHENTRYEIPWYDPTAAHAILNILRGKPSWQARVEEIFGNIRQEIDHERSGTCEAERDGVSDDEYIEPNRPFAGATNLIVTYARARDPELPRGIAFAVQTHLKVWMLLAAGAALNRPALQAQALVLIRELVREPTVNVAYTGQLWKQATQFWTGGRPMGASREAS